MVTGYMIPTAETTCICCGILCIRPTLVKFLFDNNLIPFLHAFQDMYAKMRTRLVMSNTFYGFDRALHVPPNFVCTGPTMLPDLSGIHERL